MFATAFLDIPPLASAAGAVQLPGSKSISNRLLLLAALSSGRTTLHDLLDSDDTRVMLDALRAIGCTIDGDGSTVSIDGLNEESSIARRRISLNFGGPFSLLKKGSTFFWLAPKQEFGHFRIFWLPTWQRY